MRLYWSDREGKSPPPNSLFHIKPFAKPAFSFRPERVSLPKGASYKILNRTYLPTKEEWRANVEKALQYIRSGTLQKVVLGRLCTLELQEIPDPFAITAALEKQAKGSFVFCVQLKGESFLGATPERLFKYDQPHLWTEALAGTRPLGSLMGQELLKSPKDMREFNYVQTHLQTALAPFVLNYSQTPTSLHATSHVQHLYSQCVGVLKPHVTSQQILSAVHPTPALCGTPTDKAYEIIRELEPFDRGFFGGSLGWTTENEAEWVVGIRSCHLRENIATLFSGAGIVEGSDPDQEWEELNHKLRLYDRILVD